MSARLMLILLLFAFLPARGKDISIYYTPVEMPAFLKAQYYGCMDTRLLAEDLAALLCCVTGHKYLPKPIAGAVTQQSGIFLLLDTSYQGSTNETGTVTLENNRIEIRAKYVTGLSYALYSWLHDLGYRFYLPGEEWSIYPETIQFPKRFQKIYSPHFKQRIFNPSGGAFAVKGIDEAGEMKNRWHTWYRRNRMGADYLKIDGHKGELFNIQHRALIEKDPRIVSPVNGIRAYRVDAKPDPTYAPGVTLFTNWLVEEYKKELASMPDFFPLKQYQSGDLGDGLNYCHTPECKQSFPSVSDQNFFLMNKAAKMIRTVHPDAGISTLAYTERADTPATNIQPNVHVMVVASAFQQVSTPAGMLKRWKQKTGNISLYDFLNIGVWQYDHPYFNLKSYHHFLDLLNRMQINGITMETSWSLMASAIPQYFILQYLNQPYSNQEELFHRMCTDLFGNATVPVKRIFQKWYFSDVHLKTNIEQPSFYPDELAFFFKNIREAIAVKGLSEEEAWRLQQMKAYIAYLAGIYDLFQNPEKKDLYTDQPELKQKDATALLEYTWSQYPGGIFHQTQLNDLLKKQTADPEKWNYHKVPIDKALVKAKEKRASEMFDRMEQKYAGELDQQMEENTDAVLKKLLPYAANNFTVASMDEKNFGNYLITLNAYAERQGTIRVEYFLSPQDSPEEDVTGIIAFEHADYSVMKEQYLRLSQNNGTVTFNIPAAGHYRLILGYLKPVPVKFNILSDDVLFYQQKKSVLRNAFQIETENSVGKLAVYAPGAFKYQMMFPQTRNHVKLVTPKNTKVNVTQLSNYRYQVPDTNSPYLFYHNDVMRWPVVLFQNNPIFFFAKP